MSSVSNNLIINHPIKSMILIKEKSTKYKIYLINQKINKKNDFQNKIHIQ